MLSIHDGAVDAQDRIDWRWRSTAPLGPLGDPLASDGVTLCVYDTSVAPVGLLFRSVVPPGGQCGTRPCWRAARTGGFVYADRSAAHDGTKTVQALGALPQGSRARYAGKGTALSGRPFGLPAVPLPTSLYVQLQADGGACFGAAYAPSGVRRNDPVSGSYRARSQ